MKKFKTILYAASILGAMTLASCTDLTENIYSELTKDNYYIDPQSVESAVVRCYEHLPLAPGWKEPSQTAQFASAAHNICVSISSACQTRNNQWYTI